MKSFGRLNYILFSQRSPPFELSQVLLRYYVFLGKECCQVMSQEATDESADPFQKETVEAENVGFLLKGLEDC